MEHIFLSLSVAVGQALRRIRDRKKRKYDQSISTEPGWYFLPLSLCCLLACKPVSLLSLHLTMGVGLHLPKAVGTPIFLSHADFFTLLPHILLLFILGQFHIHLIWAYEWLSSIYLHIWWLENSPEIVLKMLVRIFIWAAEIDICREISDAEHQNICPTLLAYVTFHRQHQKKQSASNDRGCIASCLTGFQEWNPSLTYTDGLLMKLRKIKRTYSDWKQTNLIQVVGIYGIYFYSNHMF